jgi:hypothetical protein
MALLVAFAITATGCVRSTDTLVFLTRTGCVQTYEMRQHLDAAIVKVGWRWDYEVINLSSLAGDDPRKGYPTPTVLYRGEDLFRRETPMPAPGDPT